MLSLLLLCDVLKPVNISHLVCDGGSACVQTILDEWNRELCTLHWDSFTTLIGVKGMTQNDSILQMHHPPPAASGPFAKAKWRWFELIAMLEAQTYLSVMFAQRQTEVGDLTWQLPCSAQRCALHQDDSTPQSLRGFCCSSHQRPILCLFTGVPWSLRPIDSASRHSLSQQNASTVRA